MNQFWHDLPVIVRVMVIISVIAGTADIADFVWTVLR